MATDRYLKGVLTVIALALVYLCVMMTPVPAVVAQTQPKIVRPGEIAGPMEVVIVGWRGRAGETLPVAVANPITATVQNTVQVTGRVTTERSTGNADRVVLVGWEERADPARGGAAFRPFDATTPRPGLPTSAVPR